MHLMYGRWELFFFYKGIYFKSQHSKQTIFPDLIDKIPNTKISSRDYFFFFPARKGNSQIWRLFYFTR